MPDTPVSLLERLRLRPDDVAWQRLVDLYAPLIHDWLARHRLKPPDADDLSQDVMAVLVRELPNFRHDLRAGSFRRWLKTITVNRLRNFWRSGRRRPVATAPADIDNILNQWEQPDTSLSKLWDLEHDRHVVRRLLELIEPEFEPATWQAFRLVVFERTPTAEVARRLGISPNAVRIAKSRVLTRFRKEAEGLID
jgi:RNA polymerase sigma-70 factor (ECF subfamily)